jgi:transglutaminase-like putative cysteine protease
VALAAAVLLATLPLVPVFGLDRLGPPALGGALVGAGVAGLAARMRWGAAVTVLVALVAYLAVGTVLAVPQLAFAAVLPTGTSALALLGGVITSWKQVLTLDPELGGTGNVLVAPLVLTLGGSLAAVTTALRGGRRAGTAAPVVPLGVLVVSVLLGTKTAVAPVAGGVVLVLGLGTWAAWRQGSLAPRRVVALALVAVVVAALGTTTGPWVAEQRPRFVLRDEVVPPFDPSRQPSPLSAFRKFVKEWDETDLFTVRGLPEGAVVRLATMDAFDGVVWDVAGAEAAEGSGSFRQVGSTVDQQVRTGEEAEVEFTVLELPFVWLPTVGWTRQVTFEGSGADELRSELRYNDATGTAVLPGGVAPGTRWTADVVLPERPADDELESATAAAVTLPEPQAVPDSVGRLASEIAGTAASPGLIALSLEQGLADRGFFSHGLTENGEAPSLSGHGADRVDQLLAQMVGDGEQYASAMALMAREMGLPARVVLGFVPDDAAAGEAVTVRGSDVQAWVEIAFSGYGWVAFQPTPDESRTPQQDVPEQQATAAPQVRQPPPPPQEPVTPPDDDTEQPRTQDSEEQDRASAVWALVGRVALVAGVPLVLVLGPPLLVAAVKRRRRRRRRWAFGRVTQMVGGWDELVDHATDLRRPPPDQATRREVAVALAEAFTRRPAQDAVGAPGGGALVGGTLVGGTLGGGTLGGGAAGRGSAAVGRAEAAPASRRAGVAGSVATLAARADAAVFGSTDPTPGEVEAYWRQVDAAIAALRGSVPRRARWRSRWSLASVRRRRRR